ncbi:hypothetical protein DFH28DRAFT_950574 [Melampsora americana]|nr:hypothetical protein DFH28DRAFT_950574 [Melampsora americana]
MLALLWTFFLMVQMAEQFFLVFFRRRAPNTPGGTSAPKMADFLRPGRPQHAPQIPCPWTCPVDLAWAGGTCGLRKPCGKISSISTYSVRS